MLLTIRHTTQYLFDAPVPYGLQRLRMTPKSRAGQRVVDWSTEIEGGKVELGYTDQHNNHVDLVSALPGTTEITIVNAGTVETTVRNGIVGPHGGFVPLWLFLRPTVLTRPGKGVAAITRGIDMKDTLAGLHALSAAVLEALPYRAEDLDVHAAAEDAIARGHGVCQDHTHIFITAARKLGVPARYVSGYLHVDGEDVHPATHAWAEAHVDGLGWVGFDVSNSICPDERYVRVATGLDYFGASPASGLLYGHLSEKLIVSVIVEQ